MITDSAVAFIAGLILTGAIFPAFLTVLVRAHAGQRIQSYGPDSHRVKAGTPTMGGALFAAVTALTWVLIDHSRVGFVAVFALLAGAALGCIDDISNVRGRGALGLLGRQKLFMQAVIGILVGIGLYRIGATHQTLLWFGAPDLGLGIVPVAALAVMATTNAVNLTDGVDGLAGACVLMSLIALIALALHTSNTAVAVVAAATAGTLVGFLFFNWYPARVFMGDTGALALGALLATLAAELHILWLLPLLGIVFVVETASVIINVTAVRRFHRRLLRASPLHHHFEQGGLREQRLVMSFAAVSALAALLTYVIASNAVGVVAVVVSHV